MKLSVLERIKLLSILPVEGTFATLRIVRRLREALSFTESEHKQFGLREEVRAGQTVLAWDSTADREYRFQPKAHEVITETLRRLDQSGRLQTDMLSLAEKFLLEEDDKELVTDPVNGELIPQPA